MTRRTNARIAGFTYLAYIAFAFPAMVISRRIEGGNNIAERLANIAGNASTMRTVILLSLLSSFCALVLAVTLYAITREEDRDIALLGFTCRVGEGLIGGVFNFSSLGLLWAAAASTTNSLSTEDAGALGALMFGVESWSPLIAATFFAVGSTLFCSLLLRGRMIPTPLGWLGVLASVLVTPVLPLQLVGFVTGPITQVMWYPLLVFEVTVAFWFIIKGVAPARGERGSV